MRSRKLSVLLGCLIASAHDFAQVASSKNADRVQEQCTAVADYSKLPQSEAKQCEAWAKQEEEDHARMHIGGIEEADANARDAARTASAQLKPLLSRLTPTQRSAYQNLLKSFQHFSAVQISGGYLYLKPYAPGEWGDGGTFASEYLRAHFDMAVTHAIVNRTDMPGIYDGGPGDDQIPWKPLSTLDEADAKLNAGWSQLESDLAGSDQAASFAKLQIEQRAWLRFRDAFVSFAKQVSPAVPNSIWVASLEANRAEALEMLDQMAFVNKHLSAR